MNYNEHVKVDPPIIKNIDPNKKRIVILGGGFGGVYTARHLEKLFRHKRDQYEIILISRDNYFTYQPMLAEVVRGTLDVFDSVSDLRNLLKHTTIYIREISDIDVASQMITLSPAFTHADVVLHYDYLVLALGQVTDFRSCPPGLQEHALPFKSLSDAFAIRNRIIDVVEAASIEKDSQIRKELLTFVVGGGGFSGIEVVAELSDFAKHLIKKHENINPKELRVVLVHNKGRLVDRELSPSLGEYAGKILQKQGIEIFFNKHLVSSTPYEAIMENDQRIPSRTIISTVPATPHLLIEALPFLMYKGRVKTDSTLRVVGSKNVWAIGDCASIPLNEGETDFAPPTAQFAVREAKCLATNIFAEIHSLPAKSFAFKSLGMMAALGHRCAIAELFGKIKISGFAAWCIWRFIYWIKLPGFARKLKVALAWLLEMFIPQESVQLKTESKNGIAHLHYVAGETIFHKGDIGDSLYVIVKGAVEVVDFKNGQELVLATLSEGDYFGEMALLNQKRRNATVRCKVECDILTIRKHDFQLLITNFTPLREEFLRKERERLYG